jgi:hypothetical protein
MKYVVVADNQTTDEHFALGGFDTREEAQWNIDHNLEWDEDDNPAEWELSIVETGDDYDCYREPDDLECGFDPYMGCYTDDC